jgi:uncharacterized membrane protein (UPF0127 family)
MSNMNLPRVELLAGEHAIVAHVARTAEEREQGLMFRRDMPEDQGMLFMCEECAVQKFWMKDTPLALSIAFLDEDGTIVKIDEMDPHSLEGCSSEQPVRWVLEANQGWFRERGIVAGQRLAGPPFLP